MCAAFESTSNFPVALQTICTCFKYNSFYNEHNDNINTTDFVLTFSKY